MTVGEAKAQARAWVEAYAAQHDILGAYLNGSTTIQPDSAPMSPYSDVDVHMVQPEGLPRRKLGKFRHNGALLEVSLVPYDSVQPEALLPRYEVVGAFRRDNVLLDPTGMLRRTAAAVSAAFAKPEWVEARCSAIEAKILNGLDGFDPTGPLLDNVNPWLFPSAVNVHLLLVAALHNPTVRLRYMWIRPVLIEAGEGALYGRLLDLIGAESLSRRTVQRHQNALIPLFDAAAALPEDTVFPFRDDIRPDARVVAIDGGQALIDAGDHREAVFWLAATIVRCLMILRADAPALYAAHLPVLMDMLADLGADSNERIAARICRTRDALPDVKAAGQRLYAYYRGEDK